MGWSEFLIIGIVLVVFIGPRELIPMVRKIGQQIHQFKRMLREIQIQLEDALDESVFNDEERDLDDLLKNGGAALLPFDTEQKEQTSENCYSGSSLFLEGESLDKGLADCESVPDAGPPAKRSKSSEAGSTA
ncbi:MAG: twin-arginine translocase TatA/TatE family subunit [Alphaproteobacteria bacterium]|nr:twin-arginine translocase TatA/TatE family subunit [Alphaproteobacteria bacterium]